MKKWLAKSLKREQGPLGVQERGWKRGGGDTPLKNIPGACSCRKPHAHEAMWYNQHQVAMSQVPLRVENGKGSGRTLNELSGFSRCGMTCSWVWIILYATSLHLTWKIAFQLTLGSMNPSFFNHPPPPMAQKIFRIPTIISFKDRIKKQMERVIWVPHVLWSTDDAMPYHLGIFLHVTWFFF